MDVSRAARALASSSVWCCDLSVFVDKILEIEAFLEGIWTKGSQLLVGRYHLMNANEAVASAVAQAG